jgi:alpha-L-fucosidase
MKQHSLIFLLFVSAICAGPICLAAETASVPPPKPYGAVPSERQLQWHELETIGMVCLSLNTFTGKGWGAGNEPASMFNPKKFDARQIVRATKAGGLKGLIIVAKHCGGFCLWPSKYNDHYTVKNSPWRNGKGDMMREFADACREEDVKLGIYLSPWDRNHKDYARPAYVKQYHNQLRELLTNYGPVFEVWFDGANGGDGYYGGKKLQKRKIPARYLPPPGHSAKTMVSNDRQDYYQWETIYKIIRECQPDAIIFGNDGPDLRYTGSEKGIVGETCWSAFSADDFKKSGHYWRDYVRLGSRNGDQWMPTESDTPQLDPHAWFWCPIAKSKSPAKLVELYYKSVGRNCGLDLGIAPDTDGLIPAGDAAALKAFGDHLRATFANNIAKGAALTASNTRGNDPAYSVQNLTLGQSKFRQYWATDDGVKDADIVVGFGKPVTFNVISLREPIQFGQRLDGWAFDSWQDGSWKEFAKGVGIGARRLWRGQQHITAGKIRLRLINASASPALSEFGVYLEPKIALTADDAAIETGLERTGWKVVSATAGTESARAAIDGKANTCWDTGQKAAPQSIVVDLGKERSLKGFLYLPRQDDKEAGIVTHYVFALSADGRSWTTVEKDEFSNIAFGPVQQKIGFARAVKARYFKFTATGAIGDCVTVAELGVIGK